MEIETKISDKNYYVYYRYRKTTKEQRNFVRDLLKHLLDNSPIDINEDTFISNQLFEFPPTLDKDFLYLSTLFTLIKDKNINNGKKIIILANGNEKINSLFNMCSKINQYYYKKHIKNNNNSKFNPVRVIPFYNRKSLCFNYKELNKSNSFDMDTYCINLNQSSQDNSNKCKYYKNVHNNNQVILYDNNKNNDNYLFESKDIYDQMNLFFCSDLCPFYYYLNKIINKDYDIIICERDYFFDNKKNISIRKVIDFDNKDNANKYLLVFDEYNDIDDYLIKIHSCIINEQLLNFSEYQLLKITKEISLNNINNRNEIPNDKIIQMTPETEIIRYNLFYDMKNYEFNGMLKSKESLIGWMEKLLLFFKEKLKDKRKITSPFKIELEILDKYYIEIKTLEQIYKRLITLFNSMNYYQYDKIYHLLHFIFFICSLSKYNENYFVINFFNMEIGGKNQNAGEFLLLKPSKILEILKNSHYVLNLTGGIGEENIIKSYYNFTRMYSYEDDNNLSIHYKTNLYLANNTNTTATDTNFYGEIIKMLASSMPDGIICYFGNNNIMNRYIEKWTREREQVFTHILNNKLIFIEEPDSERLSNIIVSYKKTINSGRGGILFLTLNNNKGKYFDSLTGKYSRCIVFIGFPKMDILNNKSIYELKRNYNKITGYENEDIDNFESFKLFASKITNKIEDINDKTIMVILEDKRPFLLSEKYKECLPKWIQKMIHPEKDDERNNINEKIKYIPEFLSMKNTTEE